MMKYLLLLTLAVGLFGGPVSPASAQQKAKPNKTKAVSTTKQVASPTKSILRVNVTSQAYNARLPWQKSEPGTMRGLGALLHGTRVLVTAELVANATYIELEQPLSGRKLTAAVDVVDYECNLAIIRPAGATDGFFDGLVPLEVSDTASIGDGLEVWQIESNGTPIITPIEISQVEVGAYFLPGHFFLQYKASGNVQYRAGTFTLPVLQDGKLGGLLLRYSSKDELSTVLPSSIIQHFLADSDDGVYEGFPNLGIEYSQTLDDQFRNYLGLGEDKGVYVASVRSGASAGIAGIEEGDVILTIDGHPIDGRGNYEDEEYGLLNLSHLVRGNAHVGDEIDIVVLREGKRMKLNAKLKRKAPEDYLVDPYMFDRGGKYLIMGGLLFQELTRPYLQSFGKDWASRAPFRLVYAMSHPEQYRDEGREKIVFLAGVLPTSSVQGYERIGGNIITTVNGKTINNIRDLDIAFNQKPKDGVHEIRFDQYPKVIWLDDELAKQDNFLFIPERFRIQERMRLE